MKSFSLTTVLAACSSLFVEHAHAAFDSLTVSSWGYGDISWPSVVQSIYTTMKASIEVCSVAVFVLGALQYAVGGEGGRGQGKSKMIWSLFALAIVVGANAVMRTVSFFVWG